MRIAIALGLAVISVAPGLQAQTPTPAPAAAMGNTTPGNVTRVVLLRIKPGQTNAFWDDVRRNTKPIFDEYKKRAIIVDYGFFTKSTFDGPTDWDVGFTLTYSNWAAFDNLGQRTDPVTLAHYGSVEQRAAAQAARVNISETAQSFLIRQQTPNPISK
jgi:hypothetical protein